MLRTITTIILAGTLTCLLPLRADGDTDFVESTILNEGVAIRATQKSAGTPSLSCVRDRVAFRGLNQTTLWGSG